MKRTEYGVTVYFATAEEAGAFAVEVGENTNAVFVGDVEPVELESDV